MTGIDIECSDAFDEAQFYEYIADKFEKYMIWNVIGRFNSEGNKTVKYKHYNDVWDYLYVKGMTYKQKRPQSSIKITFCDEE